MLGKLIVFMGAFAAAACAQPKYVNREAETLAERASRAPSAVSFPRSGKSFWLAWESLPTDEDYGSFVLKIGRPNRADASPIPEEEAADPEVVLWMPSMGHGSSPVRVDRVDVGTYRVSEVFFTMPGDWEIRVRRPAIGGEEAALGLRI